MGVKTAMSCYPEGWHAVKVSPVWQAATLFEWSEPMQAWINHGMRLHIRPNESAEDAYWREYGDDLPYGCVPSVRDI